MTALEQVIFAGSVVLARVSGVLLLAPFLSSSAIPMRVKASFAFVLTLLLYPVALRTCSYSNPSVLWMNLATELTVGALLGLSVALVFEAVSLAGQVLGVQIGFSLVNVLDPQTQVDTPVLSLLYQTLAFLIFLRLDIHLLILRGLARSFDYLPPGSIHLTGVAVERLLLQATSIWFSGIQIAAPALAATMTIDVVLAFIGKAAPQLPVLFVGLSIKNVVGGIVIAVALLTWPQLFTKFFTEAVDSGERLLHLMN
jgi:flagellar biosynthesis protein FliR